MKWVIIAVLTVLAIGVFIVAVGWLLPQNHVAVRRARFKQRPEVIWETIAGPPTWRPDVASYEMLPEVEGRVQWREVNRQKESVLFERVEAKAPKRLVTEGDMGMPGSPKVATEWSVEALAGGTCLVRVVHSLFASTDDWDNQLDGLEQGWPTYFRILRMYLERFKGQMCSAMQFVGFSTDSETKAWEKAGGELGLLNVAQGQKWSTPDGFPRMTGVVDSLGQGMHSNTLLLRLDTPAPGSAYIGAFTCAGMVMVCLSVYFYGDKAKAVVKGDEPTWQTWMGERFPMPQMG